MKADPHLKSHGLRYDWTIGQIKHTFEDKKIFNKNYLRIQKRIIETPNADINENLQEEDDFDVNDKGYFHWEDEAAMINQMLNAQKLDRNAT